MERRKFRSILVFLSIFFYVLNSYTIAGQSKNELRAFRSAKRVRVILEISGEPDAEFLPFKSVAQELLSYGGIQVLTKENKIPTQYDATLKIKLTAESLLNIVVNFSTYHHAASLSGVVSLEVPGRAYYEKPFNGYAQVSSYDAKKYEKIGMIFSDRLAPFEMAFSWSKDSFVPIMLQMLNEIYGVQPVAVALKNNSWYVRKWAGVTLANAATSMLPSTRREFPVEPLVEALKDKFANVRMAAAVALGMLENPITVEPLIGALKDEHESVRKEAAWALGQIRDMRAITPLLSALKDEDYQNVQMSVAFALGKIGKPAVVPLFNALKDEDVNVRKWSALALGETKDNRAVEPLITALKDKHSNVRMEAAEALGEIGDSRAVAPLIAALKDSDSYVRKEVAQALEKIKDYRSVNPLIAALKDEDSDVRYWAESALRSITRKDFGESPSEWQDWWEKNKTKYKKAPNGR